MKIYLASFFELENHGPGRKIGISPSKPKNLPEECGYECDMCYDAFSPGDIYWSYHTAKKFAQSNEEIKQAGEKFNSDFVNKLSRLKKQLEDESLKTGTSIQDLLGLEDGDTLLSWERGSNTHYRGYVAEFLESVGYETEKN